MSSEELAVVSVRTRSAARAFISLPYQLHRNEQRWIPPLRIAERQRWAVKHNHSLLYRSSERFLVYRRNRVVGRIAAIVDGSFAGRWAPGTGFFGFYDVACDEAASAALLATAERQLRAWNCSAALGPVNLTTHEETGLLVDGFDDPPTLLAPWNPPYYAKLLETAGYSAFRDYHAYRWKPSAEYSPAMLRIAKRRERIGRNGGQAERFTIRAFEESRFEDELRLLHVLYNRCFEDLWGYVPLTWNEYRERAVSFRPFYRPSLIRIAQHNGVAVGFAVVLPDINQVLEGLNGRIWPFGWLRLLRRASNVHRGRFILLGVLPTYRGRGVAALLADSLRPLLSSEGIEEIEVSLVQGENEGIRTVIDAMGCSRSKTYRLYTKPLTTGA